MLDHSYTLQAVMELQKAVGELTGTVRALKETVDDHGRKLNRIMYALFVAAGASSGIIWFLDKRFDTIAKSISGP